MAGYFVVRMRSGGTRLHGFVIEMGPLGTWDEVASHACRRILARKGSHDEHYALDLTESYGFAYIPLAWDYHWGRSGSGQAS